jgi:hypothetical protein
MYQHQHGPLPRERQLSASSVNIAVSVLNPRDTFNCVTSRSEGGQSYILCMDSGQKRECPE